MDKPTAPQSTATHEEIMAGMQVAIEIGKKIKAIPNPAVQQMVKELIALIRVSQ